MNYSRLSDWSVSVMAWFANDPRLLALALACAISSTIIGLCSLNMTRAHLIGFVAVAMSRSVITRYDKLSDIFFRF